MTAPENYEDLLNTKAEDAVKPPPRPGGTYLATVKIQEEIISSKKRTRGLEFTFGDLDPQSDVNGDAWEQYLNSPAIDPVTDVLTDTFWITRKALFMLKEFCEACGGSPEGKTLKEMAAEVMGEKVLVKVQQNVTENGTYANITDYALFEE